MSDDKSNSYDRWKKILESNPYRPTKLDVWQERALDFIEDAICEHIPNLLVRSPYRALRNLGFFQVKIKEEGNGTLILNNGNVVGVDLKRFYEGFTPGLLRDYKFETGKPLEDIVQPQTDLTHFGFKYRTPEMKMKYLVHVEGDYIAFKGSDGIFVYYSLYSPDLKNIGVGMMLPGSISSMLEGVSINEGIDEAFRGMMLAVTEYGASKFGNFIHIQPVLRENKGWFFERGYRYQSHDGELDVVKILRPAFDRQLLLPKELRT